MKQVKKLFLITFSLFTLILASCAPSGTQPAQGWSGTVSHNDMLYIGSMDGKVVAVNWSTQNLEWSYTITTHSSGSMSCSQTSIPTAMYGTPAVDGDLVYIGTYDGEVLSLSASARSQNLPFPQIRNGEWSYPRTNEVIGSIVGNPVVSEDAIYAASSNGKVYSLGKEFGDLNWESDVLGEKLWTSPVIEGDAVYVSTFDGYIYTLSTETGNLLPWNFKADAGFVSSPALYKDTIFVGSFDCNLYAVKIGDDEPLWRFPGGNWFWATPVIKDGVVYAGCLDGKIYAISYQTGNELWKFDTGSRIISSLVLMDRVAVVACESGEVYALDAISGKLVNKVSIGAPILGSFCVLDGIVYTRAQDNCLYAIDIGKGEINWKFPLTIKQGT